jgi:hypothetical protein
LENAKIIRKSVKNLFIVIWIWLVVNWFTNVWFFFTFTQIFRYSEVFFIKLKKGLNLPNNKNSKILNLNFSKMTNQSIRTIINLVAIITMLAGAFGMLFCFPFLWSGRIEDLIGAGLPFVGGCILFGTGLLTLGISNKQ